MLKNLSILQNASAMMKHAAARHRLIAENIANADTPGFKAKALPAFNAELAARAAEGDEIAARRLMAATELKGVPSSPNGNTVSIEDQMVRAADSQAQHEAALSIYRKTIELMRMSGRTQG